MGQFLYGSMAHGSQPVAEKADHTVLSGTAVQYQTRRAFFFNLEIFGVGRGVNVSVRVESCKTVLLEGHFLFTCSDTFAVRCII